MQFPGMILIRSNEFAQQDADVVMEVIGRDVYQTGRVDHRGAGEVVFDIGAHIGSFSVLWKRKNPGARIVCVEACPENIPVLMANVAHFATAIVHAACTYDKGDIALLNSVMPGGVATGGSGILTEDLRDKPFPDYYWKDFRPLDKVTLESLMDAVGVDRIDVLKLDCEGSEFSILENTPSLDRIGIIFGEYHGLTRWEELRQRKFANWKYAELSRVGDLGTFQLINPNGVSS